MVDRNEEQHSAKSDLLQPYERYEPLGSPGEGLGIDAGFETKEKNTERLDKRRTERWTFLFVIIVRSKNYNL